MKTCSKCGAEKDESKFNIRASGFFYSWCKQCTVACTTARRLSDPVKHNNDVRERRLSDIECCRKNERERERERRRKNPEVVRQKKRDAKRKRYHEDLPFKVLGLLRTRIYDALKGATKNARTKELIGCPSVWLEVHLESQFKPGMNWENYGPVWHIDHIKPCAAFDLRYPEQQKACFHWTNLQPLFALENLQKSDKYAPPEHTSGVVLG